MTSLGKAFAVALALALTTSGAAFADEDDCRSPMAEWQSRDTIISHVQNLGISLDRLRIDDGCYEIRGRDGDGNRLELRFDPATLGLVELKVKFRAGSDPARYLAGARGVQAAPLQAPVDAPSAAPETAPQTEGN